jgi:hypothetical protein
MARVYAWGGLGCRGLRVFEQATRVYFDPANFMKRGVAFAKPKTTAANPPTSKENCVLL